MLLNISHTNQYSYDQPLPYALLRVRLKPVSGPTQRITSWSVDLVNAQAEAEFRDQFGNAVMLIQTHDAVDKIEIVCRGEVETLGLNGIFGRQKGGPPLWYYQRQTELTSPGPSIQDLVRSVPDEIDEITRLHALSAAIADLVSYLPGETDANTRAEDALKLGAGVCQDHTHIFLAGARLLGFSARYVSGYLMMNDRVEQDATHAWAEVYVGSLGWVGFDISNRISPDERYVRVAVGLDYQDAAPVQGIFYGGSREALAVNVRVEQQ